MNEIIEKMAVAAAVKLGSRNIHLSWEDAIASTQFQIEKLKAAGYVFVPIEPNDAMISAGMWSSESGYKFYEVYQKMIEASQGGDV